MLVQQHDVSTDEHVNAIRWRRWQTPLEFDGHGLNLLLQPRRKHATTHQLLLQSRRELIFFGEPRRKVSFVLGIPAADGFFLVMLVVGIFIIIIVLVVTFAVSVAISLSMAIPISL